MGHLNGKPINQWAAILLLAFCSCTGTLLGQWVSEWLDIETELHRETTRAVLIAMLPRGL